MPLKAWVGGRTARLWLHSRRFGAHKGDLARGKGPGGTPAAAMSTMSNILMTIRPKRP